MSASDEPRNQNGPEPEGAAERRTLVTVRSDWVGPLPSPEDIERFNRVVENGGARIFAEWEAEARHRREYESRALDAYIKLSRLGRITAFAFAMSALGVAAYCASIGQEWAATVIGGGTIASVVAALVAEGRRGGEPD